MQTLILRDMITGHPGRDQSLTNSLTVRQYMNGTGVEFSVSDSHGIPNSITLDYTAARELRDHLTAWLEG